jgi:dTDP-glucose 4,6-dehydratase
VSDHPIPRLGPGRHVLVCGGAGFIGSCFVRDVLARRDGTRITVLDALTYAGNRANLAPVDADAEQAARFTFVEGDIADPDVVGWLAAHADSIVNFAAESHVDRSILGPEAFLRTGVIGVHVLLEAVLRETRRAGSGGRTDGAGRPLPAPRFLQVSTDEVYGSVEEGSSREVDPLAPRSPYAAAKAAGDLLVGSYRSTYDLDVVLTRGANTYGPYQHPEKLIPLAATNALLGLPIPLYGDGRQRRDWLHVSDHAAAIAHVLEHGEPGAIYNVPGNTERENHDIVAALLAALGRPWDLVRRVPDRPGHDRRYAMDGSRIAALGWRASVPFAEGLPATAAWYRDNDAWWRAIRDGGWDAYYESQYGARLAAGEPVPIPPGWGTGQAAEGLPASATDEAAGAGVGADVSAGDASEGGGA